MEPVSNTNFLKCPSSLIGYVFRNRGHIISRFAFDCNIIGMQYLRIALRDSLGLPQSHEDLVTANCTFVAENYKKSVKCESGYIHLRYFLTDHVSCRNKREIWRCITRGTNSVSWRKAEQVWQTGHSAFEVRV